MPYLFGPVQSRRLGRSLGIDCIPYKTCNLDCPYCECGATTRQVAEREDWFPYETILAELCEWLSSHPPPDWITFAGSGEPLLYLGIGELARQLKALTDTRLALITNGLLFQDPAVRAEALQFDLVLPSLDAARDETFRIVNRPLPGVGIAEVIEGLVHFRQIFSRSIWLEIFIIPGVNDKEAELAALREAIRRIAPDRIQLNSLDRPGRDPALAKASPEQLEAVRRALDLPAIEIVSRGLTQAPADLLPEPEAEKRILMTLVRRPSTTEELVLASGLPLARLNLLLGDMKRREQIREEALGDKDFWRIVRSEQT